jgi:hypothetical protein
LAIKEGFRKGRVSSFLDFGTKTSMRRALRVSPALPLDMFISIRYIPIERNGFPGSSFGIGGYVETVWEV